jgi:methyltransferase (TIGR00027 family)
MTTGGPSRTAMKIARFMVLLDAVPRLARVLPEGEARAAEQILRASGTVRPGHIDRMRSRGTVRLYERVEKLLGRGQLLWFGVRKRWLADAVERSIADGARQLLVVGAGFDPLAVTNARRHPEVLCVEIDAPGTAVPKRAGIAGAGLAAPNHHVQAADLSVTPLDEALRQTPWRSELRSIVVAEGLLMYLRPADVAGFFAQVHGCTGPGSRLAFTSMTADARGRPRLMSIGGWLDRFIQVALRAVGERMHWGITPEALPAFLEGAGYRVVDQPALPELRRRLLEPAGLHDEPLAPYEHLCLAEWTRQVP